MLKQVSIYAENKKGTIQNITGLLAEKNINILGSVINDGAEYGIIRMIVSDPESAAEALTNAGYHLQTDRRTRCRGRRPGRQPA